MRSKWLVTVIFCCSSFSWLAPVRAQQSSLKPVADLIAKYHQSNITFNKHVLFAKSHAAGEELKGTLAHVTSLHVDFSALALLVSDAHGALELQIPYGDDLITVELAKVNLFSEDFKVETSESAGKAIKYEPGVYYRGIVKGDATSLVAFSFFRHDLVGVISMGSGNIVVGKLHKKNSDEYVVYSDRDFLTHPPMSCHTPDNADGTQIQELPFDDGSERTNNCVRFFYELDHDIFESNESDVTQTIDWLSAVNNNVATLYNNDQITSAISGIFIWTTPDPYTESSALEELSIFKQQRPFFNGDLAQLLSMEPGGYGGVASGINTFCNATMKYCYSDIDFDYNTVPTYSWTVNVVAHEFGHLMGSYHTHNCIWPGGAIDDCGPIAGFPNEGNCPLGPDPIDGGTIMSYCHLTSFGINFNNGFGQYPANAIRGAINEASCLTGSCAPDNPSYCPSEGKTSGEWIQCVAIQDLLNNSGQGSGYSDFTGQSVYLSPGSIATLTLTPGYSGTNYEEYFTVWIDLNQDLDFADPGEVVYQSPSVNSAITGAFTIPVGLTGTTRMRISMKFDTPASPCELFKYGEVEDYTVTFNPMLTYCASSGNHADKEWIDYVNLATLERVSESDSGYYDGTALGTLLLLGSTNTLTYSGDYQGFDKTEYWKVWIDYNLDGDFDDNQEKILARHSKNKGMLTKIFTIPGSAALGKTRMRISMKRNDGPEPCETFTHGEVEDYSVIIVPQDVAPPQQPVPILHIYPNPSSSMITAAWEEEITSGVIELLDLTGRVVMMKSLDSESHLTTFDIGNLANGIYLIRMRGDDAAIVSEKVVKQ